MILLILGSIALIFIVLGWGIHHKKWYFLISGYANLSKEAQQQIDMERLSKTLKYMLYIVAILLFILALTVELASPIISYVITALLIIIPIAFTIYAKKYYPIRMKQSKKSKKIGVIISVVTSIGVLAIIYFSIQPTKILVKDNFLEIGGMYGDEIKWDEMDQLMIIDEMPNIKMRTNGSSIGSKSIGHFTLETNEKVKLFIDRDVKKFISFTWNNKRYILNEPSEEQTIALFNKMSAEMND